MKIRFSVCALAAFFIMIVFMQVDANACTAFQLKHGEQVFRGKNCDWMVEAGLIDVNKRGVSKTAYKYVVDNAGIGIPATWTSKYSSVMSARYGREFRIRFEPHWEPGGFVLQAYGNLNMGEKQ